MRIVDYSAPEPALNLALDEVLLERVVSGDADDTLRFWESPCRFVVLGITQRIAEEANETACVQDGVPILRRCSAGGCVLQGPGSLNFALAFSTKRHPEVATLHGSYNFILGKLSQAFEKRGHAVRMEGISDLAIDGLKISGNAQKRRTTAILHHGTLLYDCDAPDAVDVEAIGSYLREPSDRPDYRGRRTHDEFVQRLPLVRDELCALVAEAFGVDLGQADTPNDAELERAEALATDKYMDAAWIRRR